MRWYLSLIVLSTSNIQLTSTSTTFKRNILLMPWNPFYDYIPWSSTDIQSGSIYHVTVLVHSTTSIRSLDEPISTPLTRSDLLKHWYPTYWSRQGRNAVFHKMMSSNLGEILSTWKTNWGMILVVAACPHISNSSEAIPKARAQIVISSKVSGREIPHLVISSRMRFLFNTWKSQPIPSKRNQTAHDFGDLSCW